MSVHLWLVICMSHMAPLLSTYSIILQVSEDLVDFEDDFSASLLR